MISVGCDVHLANTKIAWLDEDTGETCKPYNVPTHGLGEHLRKLANSRPIRVVLETSTTGFFAARLLHSLQMPVTVVDAFKAKRLLEARTHAKTDKLDAQGLLWILTMGLLPNAQVWLPDETTVQLRELVRTRETAVQQGVRLRNQIRKFLNRHGVPCPFSSLTGLKAKAWLDELQTRLPPALAQCVADYRKRLDGVVESTKSLACTIREFSARLPTIRLLTTIPGVGPLLASTIAAEIGDISRFASAANLRSYARLTPTVRQSSERNVTGPLNKHGNRLLSWALVQAASHFKSSSKTHDMRPTKQYFRVALNRGPKPANVSLARHLTSIIFAMLRDGTAFDPTQLKQPDAA
jgi:transposase